VRRKLVEAEPHYPEPCAEVLAPIGELYAVERRFRLPHTIHVQAVMEQ